MRFPRAAAEVELKAQIDALLARAAQTDVTEADEPELDIPAEIERREQRVLAIQAAKLRLEERQRQADMQRGRNPNDDQPPPPSKTGTSRASKPGPKFKRAFGEPAPKAQDNFTDPDSRIMKTSTGFEQCFNAQTAVDSHRQIVVAAELTNCGADNAELPAMLDAVRHNTGQHADVALADVGYRSEAVLEQLAGSCTEVIVALGREGKRQADIDADKLPYTTAMAAKLQSIEGRAKYRRRKAIVEPPNAWIKQVLGVRQFSFRGDRQGSMRVQTRLCGVEPAADVHDDGLTAAKGLLNYHPRSSPTIPHADSPKQRPNPKNKSMPTFNLNGRPISQSLCRADS